MHTCVRITNHKNWGERLVKSFRKYHKCLRMSLFSLPLLIISLFLIGVVSDRIIRYSLVLSRAFGLSEIAAGFILLSVTTSMPELSCQGTKPKRTCAIFVSLFNYPPIHCSTRQSKSNPWHCSPDTFRLLQHNNFN